MTLHALISKYRFTLFLSKKIVNFREFDFIFTHYENVLYYFTLRRRLKEIMQSD